MEPRLEELNTLLVDTFDAILRVEEKNLKKVRMLKKVQMMQQSNVPSKN